VGAPPIYPPPPTLARKLPRGIRQHALAVSYPEPPNRATYRLNREIRGFASEGRYNIHEIAGGGDAQVLSVCCGFRFPLQDDLRGGRSNLGDIKREKWPGGIIYRVQSKR